ncbi:hypothetical protein PHYPSEUDO_003125 [Phytophthora pseudosyringae]|uniref:Uncharacterized protein n=1 Tax=Phytophthora pseudosyringae TaxID=221518 RepID=A0A8T1WJM4_9STRA|nr:hypothetical protein PHYPSEUDO_003125 [Phytophthora pseudosyringae]
MRNYRIVAVVWTAFACIWVVGDATASTSCAARVSSGDQGVGISAIEDVSCTNGGVGCFSDGICRYCQNFASPQSSHLAKCSSVTPATQIPAPTPSQSAPTSTIPASTATDCAALVKKSTLSGISFVTDKTCNVPRPTALGCTALTTCRLCRATKNEDNQFLVNCSVLKKIVPGSVRRLSGEEMVDDAEEPKPRNFTGIALSCVGGMALVVAIIGLAHSKICRRDDAQANCAVDETGLATDSSDSLDEKNNVP